MAEEMTGSSIGDSICMFGAMEEMFTVAVLSGCSHGGQWNCPLVL